MFETSVISRRARPKVGLICAAFLCLIDVRSGVAATRGTPASALRVATRADLSGTIVDPARPRSADERWLARNLFARLLEYDDDGEVIPGLSEAFAWRGRTLVLTFGPRSRSARGAPITALDVARSIRRTLILAAPRAGFGDILCAPIRRFDQECAGLAIEGESLRLTPRRGVSGARLVAALTTTEFSFVPPEAYASSVDLAIRNADETSGAYRLARPTTTGEISLRANPAHYAYAADIPQVVTVLSVRDEEISRAIAAGAIDLLPPPLRPTDVARWLDVSAGRGFIAVESASPALGTARRALVGAPWTLTLTPEAEELELWKVRLAR